MNRVFRKARSKPGSIIILEYKSEPQQIKRGTDSPSESSSIGWRRAGQGALETLKKRVPDRPLWLRKVLRPVAVPQQNAIPNVDRVTVPVLVPESVLVGQAAQRARMVVDAHRLPGIPLRHLVGDALRNQQVISRQLNPSSPPVVRDAPLRSH